MLQPGPSTATNEIQGPHRQPRLEQKKTHPPILKLRKGVREPALSLNMAPGAVVGEGPWRLQVGLLRAIKAFKQLVCLTAAGLSMAILSFSIWQKTTIFWQHSQTK